MTTPHIKGLAVKAGNSVLRVKTAFLAFLFTFVICVGRVALPGGRDVLFADSVPPFVLDMATKFLDNPADFLFNLHSDMEDSIPVPAYRRAQLRFNFFPSFIPMAWPAFNLKIKILNEREWIPQIDIQGQYGQNAAVTVAGNMMQSSKSSSSTDTVTTPSLYDYTYGIILTKKLSDKTRIFLGPKYSYVNLKAKFDPPIKLDESGTVKFTEFNISQGETFLFWGLEHKVAKDRFVASQITYGLTYNKLVARITASSPHVEVGMNIYPEGVFVIHPFMGWHWYF